MKLEEFEARINKVNAAIARIEESRQSHVYWAEHIVVCDWCQEHGPPQYIQTVDEHLQIVSEYDIVLEVLREEKERLEWM